MVGVNGNTALVVTTVAATAVVLSAATLWRRHAKAVHRGQVAKIMIYPIKSCCGVSVLMAKCTLLGLQHGILRDRSFMILDTDTSKFISLVELPSAVLIQPSLGDDGKSIWLTAPGMDKLQIDMEHLDTNKGKPIEITYRGMKFSGYDCGDEHAQWFQTFLKKPSLRLVYQGDRPHARATQLEGYGPLMKKTDLVPYNFVSAYSMNSESSHEDLNKRLTEQMPITNFRPNITVSGTQPYEEDKWNVVKIGEEAVLQIRKLCQRCAYVNLNADTGIKDPTVLKTLLSYRKCWDENLNKIKGYTTAIMGLNLGLEREGTIRVDDPVYVTFKKITK